MKDSHTLEGQAAHRAGAEAEQRFYNSFRTPPQWISQDSEKLFVGHDFIVGTKRVEVKSNSGWNKENNLPHSTCCVEVVTRGGNTVGWKRGGADIFVMINRLNWQAHIYDAKTLKRFSNLKDTQIVYEAECFIMDWRELRAGYIKTVQL
jgi:hypothetical protein